MSNPEMVRLGKYLRKIRIQRGHTQKEVAAAVGRTVSWVSDVEHGRRGGRMNPVIALLWADYLSIEPDVILEPTGLSGHRAELARVSQYLETTQWAHKYLHARERLKGLLHTSERLSHAAPQAGGLREDALSLKSGITDVLTLLHIPRKTPGISHDDS